ncbi:MAG: endoglucanase [Candidatus Brocadia sp. AMX2]|uniref:cellulase n=1 Tax=Candidatus Brocadia sinica JPN1 TaxID=1197129 RepID=A0ABQ0JY72_9BACT|nr:MULTISPECIES: glycosyl hydrolase family 8 [Brocadia]MBC6932891.1 endoglucanase [Candidatus Brocadia sp.]MBL1167623.1 endoglucanase [Candidatus Brocadia sp. AMX1]MCK6467615.1 glycosyl hydrolase family 8 [Candidatus Brocadia sinica]NOG40487.1 endoglucanase [Planctomycetota bacterium]KAA0242084.1 MAG: endoglucanase [Candidatus Brocadia sp. AMX2]
MNYKNIFFVITILCLPFIGCTAMKRPPETQLQTWWRSYKKNFILPDGRVQRPEHDFDTVSEGQAYAMLFSVFMKDKNTFDLIFDWTEKHLSRSRKHGDSLLAWYWKDGGVNDWMAASDADCDYAFALLLASNRWRENAYREKAVQVINDILKLETARGADNRIFLLPGLWGTEKDGYLVQNPSYYSPVAFRLFSEITQDRRWLDLTETGYWILHQSGIHLGSVSGCGLVPDWCVVDLHGNILTMEGKSNDYGWEAVRIPMRVGLDLLWHKSEEGYKVSEKMFHVLQKYNSDSGEIKAVYRYTGESAVEYGGLPSSAMAYFTALVLNTKADKFEVSFRNKLSEKSLILNYYGQSLAFFPLAFEDGILQKP